MIIKNTSYNNPPQLWLYYTRYHTVELYFIKIREIPGSMAIHQNSKNNLEGHPHPREAGHIN